MSLVLLDLGCDVTAENGDEIAKLVLTILAAVAEWERPFSWRLGGRCSYSRVIRRMSGG